MLIVINLAILIVGVHTSHFRGGWITYTAVADHGTHVTIRFTANWTWRWSAFGGTIGSYIQTWDMIYCRLGCGTQWSPNDIGDTDFTATALSTTDDWISGEKVWTADLPKVSIYRASFFSCCWISLNTGGWNWEVPIMLNTLNRPDGKINSSPVSNIAAIVKLKPGVSTKLSIPYTDPDGDAVRCRQPVQADNECGDICLLPPGVTLASNTCTLTFNTALMINGWYGVSVMLEDFINKQSTAPLSGVVVQFLALVCGGTSSCGNPPIILGDRAAGSCFGLNVGSSINERIVAQVGCLGVQMENIQITGPAGINVATMYQLNSLDWAIDFTWTPSSSQAGGNIICATATDNECFASNMHCYTILVGAKSPAPLASSLNPKGILSSSFLSSSTTITWSITFDTQFELTQMSSFVKFYSSNSGQLLFQIDVTSFPSVTFTNNDTLTFQTGSAFSSGNYYILMDSIGGSGGSSTCGVTCEPIVSTSFWTFSVPSSITLTTTTPATATMPNAIGNYLLSSFSTNSSQTSLTSTAASTLLTFLAITTSTSSTTTTTTTTTITTGVTTITTSTTTISSTSMSKILSKTTPTHYKTQCNKNTFVTIIAGLWSFCVCAHCIIFFITLFTLTNK